MRRRVIVLAVIAAAAGCGVRAPKAGSAAFRGAPVILISIDTLRADHLPLYGYRAGATPVLDGLARDGIVFDDVYSHCPLTLPAHTSLLTGLLPFRHGVRDNIGYALDARYPTLATRLKAAGYRTGAAVSAFVLRRQTGIAHGFDFFDDRIEQTGSGESLSEAQRNGAQTVDALAAWVAQQGGAPVFAFLHLYEPHTPYAPPPAYHMANAYDGEIAYADALVGRFLERLADQSLLDRAIVAVVSDHGEGLGDHGEAEHGIFLYREALHVPWILRLPHGAEPAGVRVAGTLGHVDVAATLLDLVGADATRIDGHSVAAALSDRRVADTTVYSETIYPRIHYGWSDLASATDGRYRFIRAPRPELFDLASDPRERQNIVGGKPSTAAALDAWLSRATSGTAISEPTPATADVRERLKALGYVTTSAPPISPGARLPDPKDGLGPFEALQHAQRLANAGRHAEAIDALRRVTAAQPNMRDAWESLATTLVKAGRTQEAIDAFGRVLALDPLKPETHLALARVYALAGNPDKARGHAELAAQRDPAAAYETLATLAMDTRRFAEVESLARRSLDADATRPMSRFLLGTALHRQGRCAEATAELTKAVDAMRLQPHLIIRNVHATLGDCLARGGRLADAEREFKAELAAIPSSSEARVGLASLYRSQGRDADARVAVTGLVDATPQPTADTYFIVIKTLSVLGDNEGVREWTARARQKFPRDERFR